MEKQSDGLTKLMRVLRDSCHAVASRRQAVFQHEHISDVANHRPWDMRHRAPETFKRIIRRRGTIFLNDESGTTGKEKCQDTVVRMFSCSLLPFLYAPFYWWVCI